MNVLVSYDWLELKIGVSKDREKKTAVGRLRRLTGSLDVSLWSRD